MRPAGTGSVWTSPALTVFRQFFDPAGAYGSLSLKGVSAVALTVVALVAVVWAFLPRLLLNWDELEADWESGRRAELLESRPSETGATYVDSIVTAERNMLRMERDSLPWLNLVTRVFYALLGAGATFALAKSLGWRSANSFALHAQTAALAQGCYVLVSGALIVAAVLLRLPEMIRLSPGLLLPTAGEGDGGLLVFFHRFLDHMDLPSVITIVVWGTGLGCSSGEGKPAGLRLVGTVYLLGVVLVSAPALMSGGS